MLLLCNFVKHAICQLILFLNTQVDNIFITNSVIKTRKTQSQNSLYNVHKKKDSQDPFGKKDFCDSGFALSFPAQKVTSV